MARSSEPGLPHKGWEWIGLTDAHDDLGLSFEEYPSCEFCGQAQIRGLHKIRHPLFPEELTVGCDCVVKLTEHYAAAQKAEKEMYRRAARRSSRENFPARKSWKTSAKGNLWIRLDSHHVVVFPVGKGYRLCIDGTAGTMTFATVTEAQLRAFDVVQQQKRKKQN